jgi:ABC-2 type transport system permease protein
LTRWWRNPLVPLQSLAFPTILLFVYSMLVSESMRRLTGSDNLDVVVCMCALAGGMSGSLAAALSIPDERDNGLLSRFWLMPIHRASVLVGTLSAEALRTFGATLLITVTGLALGLRFHAGVLAALIFLLIPVLWVTVYATIVLVVALRFRSRTLLTWLSTFSLGSVFGSTSVAPVELFPGWLRSVIRFQPLSPTIEAMRGLARDGFLARPLLETAAWLVGCGLVAGALAVRSYRVAAQSGR